MTMMKRMQTRTRAEVDLLWHRGFGHHLEHPQQQQQLHQERRMMWVRYSPPACRDKVDSSRHPGPIKRRTPWALR
jgi:hypothetical protein